MRKQNYQLKALAIVLVCCLFCSNGFTQEENRKIENPQGSSDNAWVNSVNVEQFAEQTIDGELDGMSELQAIASNIQDLKADVIVLNKDLRKMEEKLLFPSNTRYTVFVSLTTGQFFALEGVKLKIDGKLVASHVYSEKQRTALSRGGVHKLYDTNLNEGIHTITAFFTGLGLDGRPYKRAANLEFEKSLGSEFLELSVIDNGATQEPEFELKRW
ncbi:AraC family transcriptional regulator [Teredinibacter haidensis]|uniref:AraC family transcriptional regulator n=1 Tax=Teredinibacter haidensis TaxID=2731755 RepID=UPI000A94CF83|nr:AraC family transcriptional regulator [Teredinibacter haidensis]